MARTIITGGTVVNSEGTLRADLIIEGEKVSGIVAAVDVQPDDTVIDASDLLVLPGIVDAHTHIQLDTGVFKTADNWEIGTKAAAAGGVTTVIDFANQLKGQPFSAALAARQAEAADAIIDYTFHMVILDPARDPQQLEADLQDLLELGIPSVKLFTTYRPNYYVDDATLLHIFEAMPDGMLAMVHAENDSIVTDATERLVAEGKTGWKYHAKGRPAVAETEAINRLIYLAGLSWTPLYIAHCTTVQSIVLVETVREDYRQPVFCETCPQYLILDDSCYDGPLPQHYILQPPLRPMVWQREEYPTELWTTHKNIQVISTDSCDYTIAQKTEHKEFTKTPGGLPGVETLLPLLYTYGVCDDRLPFDVSDMVQKICSNPAKIFGLYPRKGALNVGSDADVVLYDPQPEGSITHEDLHYLAGYSPYEGMRVKGRVVMTLSRGEVIYRYGEDDLFAGATTGRGQFVPGAPFNCDSIL